MFHSILTAQFPKMLGNLSSLLEIAEKHASEKKFEVEVLLNARLAPDQFHFIRQVQIACDTAKLGAARLAGKEKDAPSFPDTEVSVAELQSRIASTIDFLKSISAADLSDASGRRISQPRWAGKTLSGAEFFEQHVIPNFYFHVTTAYAILRHNGVAIGKKDYLGPMPFQEAKT
jgi:hypothetical protein